MSFRFLASQKRREAALEEEAAADAVSAAEAIAVPAPPTVEQLIGDEFTRRNFGADAVVVTTKFVDDVEGEEGNDLAALVALAGQSRSSGAGHRQGGRAGDSRSGRGGRGRGGKGGEPRSGRGGRGRGGDASRGRSGRGRPVGSDKKRGR
jgi:hypothetical protein